MNIQEATEKVRHLGKISNPVYYIDNDNAQIETHTFLGICRKYTSSDSRYFFEVIMDGDGYPNIITMPMEDTFATKEQAAEALNQIILKKIEDLQSKIIPTGTK